MKQDSLVKSQVFVFIERKGQSIDSGSLNLLPKARDLAGKISGKTVAVTLSPLSDVEVSALAREGVNEVIAAESPSLAEYNPELYSNVLTELIRRESPAMFLAAHTVIGVEVVASVAGKLGVLLLTNCIDMDIEPASGGVLVTRPMFGGSKHVKMTVPASVAIVGTLQSRSWEIQACEAPKPVVRQYDPSLTGELLSRVKVLSTLRPSKGGLDLTKADIIVSIGRGIGSKNEIPMYRELADALGGVLACSRPLTDQGWLPPEHLVGMSGSTVKPKVYLACGISGAYQHIMAMQDTQAIIAINKDPSAPIFEVAHYGAVADLNKVIPSLLKLAKESRASA